MHNRRSFSRRTYFVRIQKLFDLSWSGCILEEMGIASSKGLARQCLEVHFISEKRLHFSFLVNLPVTRTQTNRPHNELAGSARRILLCVHRLSVFSSIRILSPPEAAAASSSLEIPIDRTASAPPQTTTHRSVTSRANFHDDGASSSSCTPTRRLQFSVHRRRRRLGPAATTTMPTAKSKSTQIQRETQSKGKPRRDWGRESSVVPFPLILLVVWVASLKLLLRRRWISERAAA